MRRHLFFWCAVVLLLCATPNVLLAATNDRIEEETYTIAWISDTQIYSWGIPKTFYAMTDYLKNAKDDLNIGYVVHTGDIVGTASKTTQWQRARKAMDNLNDIPYGVLAGNHDRTGSGNYSNYKKYFGQKMFEKYDYYGASLEDNLCHYDLITLGNTKYVFVYLSYQPGDKWIAWANAVFQKFPNRVGVLCTHDYIDTNSTLRTMGKTLLERVVKPNPNVYMVLCGHRYTEDVIPIRLDDDGDGKNDRTVYQCIANYQEIDNKGGSGYIRFLEINEAKQTIRFYTYSPVVKKYRGIPDTAISRNPIKNIPWRRKL